MPALFLRLKGGRIWYEPGFGEGEGDFDKWEALVGAVRRGKLHADRRPRAGRERLRIAARRQPRACRDVGFPLAEHQRSELQQVSQFLQFNQDVATAREKFRTELRRQILRRHDVALRAEARTLTSRSSWRCVGQAQPRRRTPTIRTGSWRSSTRSSSSPPTPTTCSRRRSGPKARSPRRSSSTGGRRRRRREREDDGRRSPTPTQPLVFHIFGYFRDENSLVLTEDDYFDYLISLIQYKPRIPGVVGEQTTSTSLLFLGFQLTDWNFRVLLPADHEPGGELEAQAAHPRRGAGRSRGGRAHQPAGGPQVPRGLLRQLRAGEGPRSSGAAPREFLKELNNQLESMEEAIPVGATADADDW